MEMIYSWSLLFLGSIFDIKRKSLPSWFLIVGGVLAVIMAIVLKPVSLWDMAGGVFLGAVLLGISFLTKGALGRGDGIFIGIIGLNMGFITVFTVFSGALILAALLGLVLILAGRVNRKTAFPFLPFLSISYGILCLSSLL